MSPIPLQVAKNGRLMQGRRTIARCCTAICMKDKDAGHRIYHVLELLQRIILQPNATAGSGRPKQQTRPRPPHHPLALRYPTLSAGEPKRTATCIRTRATIESEVARA